MQIISIEGYTARCERDGIQRDVNLYLLDLDKTSIGDFVMVHVGYAIQKIEQQDALERWSVFKQMQNASEN